MTKLFNKTSPKATVIVAVLALGAAAFPGTAQAGFFENLFGGGTPAPQAPAAYNYDAPIVSNPVSEPRESVRTHRHVVKDERPVLQKTTDIWHDKTLRGGDAVMMKDGLHVFTGSQGDKLAMRDLPRIDSVDMSKKDRALLVSMDTTRNDPLRAGVSPDTIASGRSAAVASAIVAGYKITDARGSSVRYVGP